MNTRTALLPVPFAITLTHLGTKSLRAGVASISGFIHDPAGLPVANAKLLISSESKGEPRAIQTNEAGVFSAPALVPGPGYQVTITARGFAQNNLQDIELQIGQALSLTSSLTVAQSAESVDVSAAAEMIDDRTTDVSQVIGEQQIDNLPINGQRVDSFVLLTPGVTNDATFGLLSFRGSISPVPPVSFPAA